MITEKQLMAYVDGELSPEARAAIDAQASRDPAVREAIAKERRMRRQLADLYTSAIEEEVPERLARMLQQAEGNVVSFKPQGARRPARYWPTLTAMAASLVLGLMLAPALNLMGDSAPGDAELQAGSRLAAALQTQLASEQAPGDAVQIGISFVGPDSEPCRTFETAEAAGLACRPDREWQLRLLAPKAATAGTEYQRAGSASALVMSSVQEMIAGEPMDAASERQARDADWRVAPE